MKKALLGLTFLSSLAACASVDNMDTTRRVLDEDDFVTGSNLPRRKSSLPSEAGSMSKDAAEDMMRTRPMLPPSGGPR